MFRAWGLPPNLIPGSDRWRAELVPYADDDDALLQHVVTGTPATCNNVRSIAWNKHHSTPVQPPRWKVHRPSRRERTGVETRNVAPAPEGSFLEAVAAVADGNVNGNGNVADVLSPAPPTPPPLPIFCIHRDTLPSYVRARTHAPRVGGRNTCRTQPIRVLVPSVALCHSV